jgi:hypothetical protein
MRVFRLAGVRALETARRWRRALVETMGAAVGTAVWLLAAVLIL